MATVAIARRPAPPLHAALDGYAERGSGVTGLALAALWIVVAGTVIYAGRRRLFPQAEKR
jgi:hypothetical protein